MEGICNSESLALYLELKKLLQNMVFLLSLNASNLAINYLNDFLGKK